ncbi:hypothetical protein [Edaphobacter dinghuensis]|uniref:hypothetical protein n=1 Tax=Edaphobacter dinghuensis TaxID=1560005 RepID=UPI0021DFBCC6|nr:hypothetical protein [Edaphobacter dinghuensis]
MRFCFFIILSALFCVGSNYAQVPHTSKIDLGQYGFTKTKCLWRSSDVEFLDNDHIALIAPSISKCEKSLWDSPTDTTITVIDRQGRTLSSTKRSDVIKTSAGPLGTISVCLGDRIELLSSSLEVLASIPLSGKKTISRCSFYGALNPSRNVIAISSTGHFDLYRLSPSANTVVEVPKGYNVRAVADDGLLLCKQLRCEVLGSSGVVRSFPPLSEPAFQNDIAGLITKDKLLVADRSGKSLYTLTPTGDKTTMADLTKIRPPFIDTSDVQLSAMEPRRVLYSVEGCLLGDFDDCYGEVFHRFAVFDSTDGRLVFRHSYAVGAVLKISPDGHMVIEQDGMQLHLYDLP